MKTASDALRQEMNDKAKATRRRGEQRATEILKTGREILIDEGYHRLTLRRIAEKMGISKGNLTYYYPDKETLLRAILLYTITLYTDIMNEVTQNHPGDHRARLLAYIDYLIADAKKAETQRFFYQLFALSSHNEEAAELRTLIYEQYLAMVQTMMQEAYPELSEALLMQKCFMVMSLIEGIEVMQGSGARFIEGFGDVDQYIKDEVIRIIEG